MNYFFTVDRKKAQGPATLEQLAAHVRHSKLPSNVLVCEAGGKEWKPIGNLVPAIQLEPLPQAASTEQQPTSASAPAAAVAATTPTPSAQSAPTAGRPATVQARMAPATSEALALRGSAKATAMTVPTKGDLSELAVASTTPVDAKKHVSAGTGLHTVIGYLVMGTAYLVFFAAIAISTFGLALLIMGLIYWVTARRARARIQGSGVKVTAHQFPDIHRCVRDFAQRLGMPTVPEVYIVEGSVLNAVAAKLGKRSYIVLVDDIVHGCLRAGETQALAFILGHELAHHALGHTGLIRGSISASYRNLSRCDELTCDAAAKALVEDANVCARGLGMLMVGPELIGHLDWPALDRQAQELLSKKTWKGAEGAASHPLPLRRYAVLRGLA